MNTLMGGMAVALVLSVSLGFISYELLVRRFMPAKERQGLKGRTAQTTENKRGVLDALVLFTAQLERIMPITRTDSEEYRESLERAGLALEPETWRGVRVLCVVVGVVLSIVLLAANTSLSFAVRVVMAVVGGVFGWLMPALVLMRRTARRRAAIEAQLPDAMELLGIAVAAGSPVEQCFREVAENMESPLADEFALVDREVNLLGHSRDQALEKFVRRCGSVEVAAFVAQLSQAINQGSSLSEGLASQAALAHEMAQASTLERIRKMLTKLDIVLSFCFLPPTIALVVMPTIINLLSFLQDTL